MVQCWGKRSKVARVCFNLIIVFLFLALILDLRILASACHRESDVSAVLQSAVHIPCCPSFRWNPLKWRGICFGRQAC